VDAALLNTARVNLWIESIRVCEGNDAVPLRDRARLGAQLSAEPDNRSFEPARPRSGPSRHIRINARYEVDLTSEDWRRCLDLDALATIAGSA
jgi:hypothetical protein